MATRRSSDGDTVQVKELDTEKAADVGVEAKVDKYPERSYWDALTDEHREVLKAAGQLPPKPDAQG